VQIRYGGYWFKQLILITVFYFPDKSFVISPKQLFSNHYLAISAAGDHATAVERCKTFKVNNVFHSKISFRLLLHGYETTKDVVSCVSCKNVHQ
jgi:hypothetical protein